jgi:hypothetical protein
MHPCSKIQNFSVPLAAAIGVLTRFALRHYYESPLYKPASD